MPPNEAPQDEDDLSERLAQPLSEPLSSPSGQTDQHSDPKRRVVAQQIVYSFSGPLPPPRELQGYDNVIQGGAERIFRMREEELRLAEKQVLHRMEMENKVIDSDIKNSRLGIVSANVWLFVGLGISALFVMTGHDAAGEIIGPAVIGSMLTAFLSNNSNRRKERLDKMKLLTGKDDKQSGNSDKNLPDQSSSNDSQD